MRLHLNFVCNHFVLLGFVSAKVLTFTCLLHFATTTHDKSNHLDEKVMLHTICLAATAGRSPLQYAAASRKPVERCMRRGDETRFTTSFSFKSSQSFLNLLRARASAATDPSKLQNKLKNSLRPHVFFSRIRSHPFLKPLAPKSRILNVTFSQQIKNKTVKINGGNK